MYSVHVDKYIIGVASVSLLKTKAVETYGISIVKSLNDITIFVPLQNMSIKELVELPNTPIDIKVLTYYYDGSPHGVYVDLTEKTIRFKGNNLMEFDQNEYLVNMNLGNITRVTERFIE